MSSGPAPPTGVLAYARQLADRLARVTGGSLQAAYLHGSAALGGWVPGRSDVDLLLVASDETAATDGATGAGRTAAGRTAGADLAAMTQALLAAGQECPGRELEASVVSVAQARQPAAPWPYLAHVVAGPGQPGRVVRPHRQSPGDTDLLIHYAVCRAAGWPVHGPPARELIGAVGRGVILDYLAGELRWGIEDGTEAYAVLNACRGLIYLADQEIVSKIAGGEAALRRAIGPAELIRRALRQQRGSEPARPPSADAATFALAAAAALRSAASAAARTAAHGEAHGEQAPPG